MAISTSSYFSNSMVGIPQVGGDIDIYETHSLPKFPIGQKYEREDGAVFRYVQFGSAVSSNALVGSTLSEIGTVWAAANTALAPSATYQDPSEVSGIYPGSLGSRFLISGVTGTQNQYAGAYLTLVKGTGSPGVYRIRGNDLTSTTKSGAIKITLYDKLKAAVDTSTSMMITGCKYSDLAQTTTAATTIPIGVPLCAASASTWGWVQTKGMCAVISENILTAGKTVSVGGVEGTVGSNFVEATANTGTGAVAATTKFPQVGWCVGVGSATAVNLVNLLLE
jgi:hypothetical protein